MTIRDREDEVVSSSSSISPTEQQRRILFLSLEFDSAPFSGNGVLARSLVSSLVGKDHDCAVRVICAKPHPSTEGLSKDICMDYLSEYFDLEIWSVGLPRRCQWKRLDRSGPWEHYSEFSPDYAAHVKEFEPTDVVAVDWHGMLAWKWIHQHLRRNEMLQKLGNQWMSSNVNVCYYNFRVYSSSSWEHEQPENEEIQSSSDDQFYRMQEQTSCKSANVIICLAENDRCMLQRLTEDEHSNKSANETKRIHILHPPLRGDIWLLANADSTSYYDHHLPLDARLAMEKFASHSSSQKRMFITCMSRFSPEKSPHHFVKLLHELGGVEFLRSRSLIPIMCGARSVEAYAQKVVDDIQSLCSGSAEGEADWPCVIINHHLGPRELAAVFSHTVLNVHPCLYDAYGMTMVESAAFGVPSVVNGGGKVGAASLLGEGEGCIAVNLGQIIDETGSCETQSIDTIRESLQENSTSLDRTATLARTRA
eukprot:CAMPEP_0181097632 /NCGR_PEP_ID=MMETSP1071-20121207/11674_1 /TAXON_ID=35127 /ORGANISM="Thalassiosira sp., Strain NH16" /LENGTH=478 /DNA_ID=CAMNT_0023180129 /DNA_START=259 /DNA_END=1691 /DNA_ORIENTATION=-